MPDYEYQCVWCKSVCVLPEAERLPFTCPQCGDQMRRKYSFGVGRVKGAGDSPSRGSQ